VNDLINLYGSAPSKYQHIQNFRSPYISIQGPENVYCDQAHDIVKFEANEVNLNTSPEDRFYIARLGGDVEYCRFEEQ
jgi:hypothetical protein